eukprot:1139364-Rhodomonas_salina.2
MGNAHARGRFLGRRGNTWEPAAVQGLLRGSLEGLWDQIVYALAGVHGFGWGWGLGMLWLGSMVGRGGATFSTAKRASSLPLLPSTSTSSSTSSTHVAV